MSRPKKGRVRSQKRKLEAVLDEVPASLRAGLAIGGEPVDGSATLDRPVPSTADLIGHMARPGARGSVVENDAAEVWEFGDDRKMMGADRTVTRETLGRLKAGYECLRCWEPQESSFPLACSMCGYPMRDRQIHDIALEVQGEKHLGPSKPIGDYIDILDEEAEKKRFLRRIAAGGSAGRRRR